MKKTPPIQEIMNKMTGRMDMLLDQHDPLYSPRESGLEFNEIHLWIAVDPLLADLHKRYLDLRGNHQNLLKRHGMKDQMTSIAADMADSARCAVDTRMIEVQQNPALCAAVRTRKIKAHNDRVREQTTETQHFQNKMLLAKSSRLKQQAGESFWMLFVLLILMRDMVATTRHRLSIAMTFQNATGASRELRSGSC